MTSLIGEYQWQATDRSTVFVGGRIDDHSNVERLMKSPRLAWIFRPNDSRTFKWVVNNSIRRSDELSLEIFKASDVEDIEYLDFIYHEQINASLSSQLSFFYAKHNLINFDSASNETIPIGQTEFTGFDWELSYQAGDWRTLFSVSYVDLLDLELVDPTIRNSISAEPQGFGDDFAEAPSWTLKLHSQYWLDDRWNLNGSIVSDLGVDGRRDMFEGFREREVSSKIDDGALRLNLGAIYQYHDQLKIKFNAHNVLGWLDKDYNNRFIRGLSDYRPDVASLSVGLTYEY